MHLVELGDESLLAEQTGSAPRAHRVEPVEERSREVEDRSKASGTRGRQVAEEHQDAGEGQDEDKPKKHMKEELTIRPAGVVARRGPRLPGSRGDHIVKFQPGGLKLGSEVRAEGLGVGGHDLTGRLLPYPVAGSG